MISTTANSTTLVLITLARLLNAINKSTQLKKKTASQNEIMNFEFQMYISMNVPKILDVSFKSSDFGFCLTTLQSRWEEILGIT